MGKTKIDYTNHTQGLLTIIEFSHKKSFGKGLIQSTKLYWKYRCECGNEGIIESERLARGRGYSCGCQRGMKGVSHGIKLNHIKPYETKPWSGTRMQDARAEYMRRAKSKGWKFELTSEQFWEMSNQDCHYCGTKPSQKMSVLSSHDNKKWKGSQEWLRNGLDRIDSTKGYVVDNIVPCCKTCNYMKNELSQEEFLKHIKRIIEWSTRNIK